MSKVNLYNFVQWDDDGSPLSTCENEYALPITNGDELKVYINFTTPIDDTITNWRVGWWMPSALFLFNITTLNEDDVDGVNKNLYFTYTVGVLPQSLLRLVIYDSADSNAIKYWSNAFSYKTVTTNTAIIKYRNAFDILNFEYENLTDWYNKVRIGLRSSEPRKLTEMNGYKTSSGHFVYSLIEHRKSELFETFLDENGHDAFEAATNHSELYFDDVRYERQPDEAYNQDTVKDYNFYRGSIRLVKYDSTAIAANS